jgi:poly(A) polymerase/tRNA nucleotidyltransferase (CCA-adding enzyme)
LLPLAGRVDKALAENGVFSLKDLDVKGKDLMEIGIKTGNTKGLVLDQLMETVLDDPGQNTREKLLKIAGNFYAQL